jgi:hypothetical protein
VAESVGLLEELLREWIAPLLKPEGFRKAGRSFEKESEEAIVVVNYQRSRDGGECDRFTVNLGIASKRLFAFEDPRRTKHTPVEVCHWRMRMGRTLDPPRDAWWELCSSTDVPEVGREHQEILRTKALPLLEMTACDSKLRAEWTAGRAPGITELQRLLNLSALLNDFEHRDEQRMVIEEMKDLARRKGFGGRVAVHLEELGVE